MSHQPGPGHPPDYHIAIIGGGMAGASLALLCARANPQWRIALLDASPAGAAEGGYHPGFDARSTALAAGSMDIFAACGVGEALCREAAAITRVQVSDQGYLPGQQLQAGGEPLGYVVPNTWLGRVLWSALESTESVHTLPGTVEKLIPAAGYQQLVTADGQRLTAGVCVVADGAQSPLRRALGIAVDSKHYRQRAIIANVRMALPHGGVACERFTRRGPLALLPLGTGSNAADMALVWTLPDTEAEAVLALADGEFLTALQRQLGYRLGRFTRVGKRESYPLHMQTAREQVRSQLVLLGSAAHSLHPVAGQGFNLTLRDAAGLAVTWQSAWQAGKPLGELGVLQEYLRSRRQDQQLTLRIADALVEFFSRQSLARVSLRHMGLLALELADPLKQTFHRQMAGLLGVDTMQLIARNSARAEGDLREHI